MESPPLPTRLEISPTDGEDLDERHALDHFIGKSRTEAAALFLTERAHLYLEGLMWMGPQAFGYYVAATLPWLRSAEGRSERHECEELLVTIGGQLDEHASGLLPHKTALVQVVGAIARLAPDLDAEQRLRDRILRRCDELDARLQRL